MLHETDLWRDDIKARNFVKIMEYEREIDLSKKVEEVRNLPSVYDKERYAPYEDYIMQVVNFLNSLAHLMRHKYADHTTPSSSTLRLLLPAVNN